MKKIIMAVILCTAPLFRTLAADTSEQIARQQGLTLHRIIFTLDTHCDTPLRMLDPSYDISVRHEPGAPGSGKIDLPRMQNGNLDAEFFAAFVAQRDCTPENYLKAQTTADKLIASIHLIAAQCPQMAAIATTPADGYRNQRKGLISIYIGIENGFALGHDLSRVHTYYDQGVRYITLCHTLNNDICDSSTDPKGPTYGGVSDFGKEVIAEMNHLGILVDISHASDQSAEQALALSKAPVFASHSGCRALCDHPRDLTDDLIRALAAKGGVVQICVFSEYLKHTPPNPDRDAAFQRLETKYGPWDEISDPDRRKEYRRERQEIDARFPKIMATVADVVDHIEHVIKIAGIDYVGIGTDFDGGGGVTGCNDVSEMPNITLELLRRGYGREEIAKIWGGNFMRVLGQALRVAEEWPAK